MFNCFEKCNLKEYFEWKYVFKKLCDVSFKWLI